MHVELDSMYTSHDAHVMSIDGERKSVKIKEWKPMYINVTLHQFSVKRAVLGFLDEYWTREVESRVILVSVCVSV